MNKEQIERRFCPLEIRAAEGDESLLEGYAAPFDKLSVMMWGFRERIARGFFADSIANDDVASVWNHNTDYPLGRTTNDKLRLWEDERGLGFKLWPPDTQMGKDAIISVRRGDVNKMSFAFATLEDRWDIDENEVLIRTLIRGKLYEISPVTFAAYQDTSVMVRAGEPDPVYGIRPQVPAEVQRALADAASGPLRARARLAAMKRRLRMATLT